MNPPRWFYVVLAACVVVMTAAFSARALSPPGRWVHIDGLIVFDTKSGRFCFPSEPEQTTSKDSGQATLDSIWLRSQRTPLVAYSKLTCGARPDY